MNTTPLQPWIARRLGISEEEFTRDHLSHYQLEHVNWVLEHVRCHSRFYRELLKSFSVRLTSLQELSRFPFTTAEQLRNDPQVFACVPQDDIQRIVTLPTSGTTGPSKRIFFSAQDQELTIDFFNVGMSTLARKGDRVLILLPGTRPGSVGDLLKIGLERLGCVAFVYGPVDDEQQVLQTILDHQCNVLVGAPVQIHRLARWDQAFSVLPTGQLRSVLTSTDVLADTIRENLQTIWGCEVFDHWGMTETGLGGAVECTIHEGMHLREADLFIEIIDPRSGRVLPPGTSGEVVVTALTRNAMPLIRYRTGDISRLLAAPCRCGSILQRLDAVRARVDGIVHVDDAAFTLRDLDEILFQVKGVSDYHAKLHASSTGLVLSITLIESGAHILEISEVLERFRSSPLFNPLLNGASPRILLQKTIPKTGEEKPILLKRKID